MNKKKRRIVAISSGAMADIAFLLLIFFLVTTTIEADKGIKRTLAPISKDHKFPTNERNVLVINVGRNDHLLIDDIIILPSELSQLCKAFITNNAKRDDWSVNSKLAIFSIQNHVSSEYELYITVQNEIMRAYNELRQEYAMQQFGKPFDKLSAQQRALTTKVYPIRISDAEPKS